MTTSNTRPYTRPNANLLFLLKLYRMSFCVKMGLLRHFGGFIKVFSLFLQDKNVADAIQIFARIDSLACLNIRISNCKLLYKLPFAFNQPECLNLRFTENEYDFDGIAKYLKSNSTITHLTIEAVKPKQKLNLEGMINLVDSLPCLKIFDIECDWQRDEMINVFAQFLAQCTQNIQLFAYWEYTYLDYNIFLDSFNQHTEEKRKQDRYNAVGYWIW